MAKQEQQRDPELVRQMNTRMALLDHYGTMPAIFEAWRAGRLTAGEEQDLAYFRGEEVLLSTGLWRVA